VLLLLLLLTLTTIVAPLCLLVRSLSFGRGMAARWLWYTSLPGRFVSGFVLYSTKLVYNMCHGSKGLWLEVSFDVTCSTQVLSVYHKVEERLHKMRGVDDLGLETKLRLRSQPLHSTGLNSATP
jgi:hypothetical protein